MSWLTDKRVFVAGHRGMVGAAIVRLLVRTGVPFVVSGEMASAR
jgi:nucleoside-diphosphate-sugar epimerase